MNCTTCGVSVAKTNEILHASYHARVDNDIQSLRSPEPVAAAEAAVLIAPVVEETSEAYWRAKIAQEVKDAAESERGRRAGHPRYREALDNVLSVINPV
jgi:TPP-dependent pyruvate/acetoin dehydrogenase alpha subunit